MEIDIETGAKIASNEEMRQRGDKEQFALLEFFQQSLFPKD